MFKNHVLHLCYKIVTNCNLYCSLFSFCFSVCYKSECVSNRQKIYEVQKFFYVYKSVCSKELGENFAHIIKIPFCL